MGIYKLSNAGGMTSKTRYTSMLAGNPVYEPGAMFHIASATLTSGTSYTFTNIPSNFKHLQLRMVAADDRGTAYSGNSVFLNNDTAANYSYHSFGWQPSSAQYYGQANYNGLEVTGVGSSPGARFATAVIDILDYASTSKYKTIKATDSQLISTYAFVGFQSALWRSTDAVTSLKFQNAASNFRTGSHVALYGIK